MSILYIAAHELRRYFKSPLAWSLLAVVQFLLALFFLILLNQFLNPSAWFAERGVTEIVIAGLLQVAGIIILMVTPFLTMHLFSEEHKTGTIKLLLSSPISTTELVLGKYLGLMGMLLLMLAVIALMPLSLLMGTTPDMGQTVSGLLGLLLLMSTFAAIGLFISTLTSHPAVAAVSTFAVLFILWVINLAGTTGSDAVKSVLSYLSILRHYNNLIDGMFNSVDVTYYLIVSTTFIILCIWRIDANRLYQ